MTTKHLISVIMNCYNGEMYLKEAINSVFEQNYQNFEIIFWDNKSTDNSAEIAKSFGEKVKYFQSDSTVSLGEARNLAISKAEGEFVAFLDCDDLWLPSKLQKQIQAFADPEVGVVFSDAIIFSDKKDIRNWFSGRNFFTGYCFPQLFQNYFLCMPTIMVRKNCIDKLAYGFDNRFSLIEEADIFTRIALSSKLEIVDEVLAKWRIHPDSWTWKKYESFPDEREIMVNTYISTIPSFSQNYAHEIEVFMLGIRFSRAKNYWAAGDGGKARNLLKADLYKHKKSFILYVLSLLPFKLINSILKIWGYGKLY